MICPLLSMLNKVNENNSIACNHCGNVQVVNPELVECQEEKCQWYLRRHGRIEVYDCAIAALAIYSLPSYRGGEK